jgi:hypothetical protein
MGDWRESWIVAALLGRFGLLAYEISRHHGKPVEPGSPEYASYIDDRVAVCIRQHLAADRERNGGKLPILPTPLEREATCRFIVEEFDRLHPNMRPHRY